MTTPLAVAWAVCVSWGPGDSAVRDLKKDCVSWALKRQIVALSLPHVSEEVATQEEALVLSQDEFHDVVARAEENLQRDASRLASKSGRLFLEALTRYREEERGAVPTACRDDLLEELAAAVLDAKMD